MPGSAKGRAGHRFRPGLALAVALVVCGTASAGAFPGRNGSIVFSRATSGAPPVLVAFDPATGVARSLGTGGEPAFSPDGSKLAFVRDGVVYVANADGSGAAAIGAGEFPAWSPDGGRIAVSRPDGKPAPGHPAGTLQLTVVDLAAGSSFALTDGTADAMLPAWAPGGGTIAFTSGGALETISPQGGTPAPIALPVAVDGGASWSPDGGALAFLAAGGQVWTVHADGSSPHQITYALVGSAAGAARPAWSPDGGTIAWTAGADLCLTDLAGTITRLTRTAKAALPAVASLPDWQPSSAAAGAVIAPPAGASDSNGCDWNPGARVDILDANVSPSIVSLQATQQLAFVNHLGGQATVTTTMQGAQTTIDPGHSATLPVAPGEYDFTVTGYPDGVPRRGSIVVAAAGRVTIEQHAAISYGSHTLLTGVAAGPAGGAVTVTAQAYGAAKPVRIATITPIGGRWKLDVAPAITTDYAVSYLGATADRLLRVKPKLHVSRSGGTVRASLLPAARLAGGTVFLFRASGRSWTQFRTARIGRDGTAVFRSAPPARYYVGFQGGDALWSTAGEPFTIRR